MQIIYSKTRVLSIPLYVKKGVYLLFLVFTANNLIDAQSIFDAMAYKDVTSITLTSDFDVIRGNKRDVNEHAGTLKFTNKEGEEVTVDVSLTLRGRFRRMFSQGMPPLKMDFKKKQLRNLGLEDYDDLKLVPLFYEDKAQGFQTLVKEYLVYKLYNELTENSFRVQLVEVTYIDKYTNIPSKEYAFLIEDEDQLKNRIGAKELKEGRIINEEEYDQNIAELVAVFQYFIGNGDWSILPAKNIELFEKEDKIIIVPYDFDFSGVVNASYAVPNNLHDIHNVRERIYLGNREDWAELEPILAIFEEKRDELIAIYQDCRYLSKSHKEVAVAYLNSYYDEIQIRKENGRTLKGNIRSLLAEK